VTLFHTEPLKALLVGGGWLAPEKLFLSSAPDRRLQRRGQSVVTLYICRSLVSAFFAALFGVFSARYPGDAFPVLCAVAMFFIFDVTGWPSAFGLLGCLMGLAASGRAESRDTARALVAEPAFAGNA